LGQEVVWLAEEVPVETWEAQHAVGAQETEGAQAAEGALALGVEREQPAGVNGRQKA
jgi:hypothetical protein